MESRISSWIQWSLSELNELVEDKDSCVYFERAKRHIALEPFHFNDLNKALHEILSTSIYNYDSELKGLLLSYKNPKLLSSLGSILYDSYYIHVDIEANFYIFRPEIGCTLNGIVNKQATNHIGVLVHKAFHVSIPINEDDETWQGHDVYVGQEVKFTVTQLDFKGKLPFIRGELLSDSTPTHDNIEDPKLESIAAIHSHETVNGHGIEDNDDTINKKDTTLKSSKRINFLASVLNQSSESSSDEEMKPVIKSSKRKKSKTTPVDVNKNQETICAIPRADDIPSPSKNRHSHNEVRNGQDLSPSKKLYSRSEVENGQEISPSKKRYSRTGVENGQDVSLSNNRYSGNEVENGQDVSPSKHRSSCNEVENDQNVSEQKVKAKSRSRKRAESKSECEDEDAKLRVKKQKKSQSNTVNETISSAPVANQDRKPRIIHDSMLNGNEHNIKIERKPVKTLKKTSIFAHDISDNDDDDTDNERKPLTQFTYTKMSTNVKIKQEPDTSDIESSSSNKIHQKHKNDTINESGSFAEVRVKSEPVNVKTEKKRKHKDENKNSAAVKRESDSDSSTSLFPRKKIKTKFSE